MDWLTSLIDGLGSAISGAFENLWNSVSGSIWDVFLKWIFEAIYGAIADFFTMIGGMGTDLFTLSWVKSFLKLFSLFGWSLFAAGLVVAVFDTAIEYQSMGQLSVKRQIMPILYGFSRGESVQYCSGQAVYVLRHAPEHIDARPRVAVRR